jgi:N-acetylmuramic acid 6-phosphate etherase
MHPGETLESQIRQFLTEKEKYQLGHLLTEQGHPKTEELSELARSDPEAGLKALFEVDLEALETVAQRWSSSVAQLRQAVKSCVDRGGRIFLGGCGATGRLSLCLERIWRETHKGTSHDNSVLSFMAGGDVAFVHAIEGFEDYPNYGARQLEDLGFGAEDLFLGVTEGGETPFVIGATERAAEISNTAVFFLYSNPHDLLVNHVARSRKILAHDNVIGLDLHTGPMALAGSTRMQSSTILMLVAGWCLFSLGPDSKATSDFETYTQNLGQALGALDLKQLSELTIWEAEVYKSGRKSLYNCDEYSVTVFTDTTERSPTFSLAGFDNQKHPQAVNSLTYVSIPTAETTEQAWQKLFWRAPRTLEWSEEFHKTRGEYLEGFDFSKGAKDFRKTLLGEHSDEISIFDQPDKIEILFAENTIEISTQGLDILGKHLLLKMILNAHSTLLMGRLGRYKSHFMTYVVPSNGKLIDRATRYVLQLAQHDGQTLEYDEVASQILRTQRELKAGEPVVLAVLQRLTGNSQA